MLLAAYLTFAGEFNSLVRDDKWAICSVSVTGDPMADVFGKVAEGRRVGCHVVGLYRRIFMEVLDDDSL